MRLWLATLGLSAAELAKFTTDKHDVSSFLSKRSKRDVNFPEDMFNSNNYERECFEEVCSRKEMIEIFKTSHRSLDELETEMEKYTNCQAMVSSNFRMSAMAKKQQLEDCMNDPDDCESNGGWGKCNPSNTIKCKDLIGDAECKCKKGYGDETCSTINDLCVLNPCQHGECESHYRSYQCQCDADWEGKNCTEEIVDCRRQQDKDDYACQHGTCETSPTGVELVFSGECECDPGWIGDRCGQDENECSSGSHECDPQYGTCINNYGSYECKCDDGFMLNTQNGKSCEDIDECRNAICPKPPKGGCSNTIGSFECFCNDGYELDNVFGEYCNDVNECETENGGCAQQCDNTDGSYVCSCNDGFYLDEDKHTCHDIDECDCGDYDGSILNAIRFIDYKFECHANGQCAQICNNTPGSYECACNEGYELLRGDKDCGDINECADSELNQCEMQCVNTVGSYVCSCSKGFELADDGFHCEDIDECATGDHQCAEPAFCVNDVGDYHCECPEGYLILGSVCHDIDECENNPCVRGTCHNQVGSYLCDCIDTGYTGDSCEDDLDECKCTTDNEYRIRHVECQSESVKVCDQSCLNEVGSYSCFCRDSYYLAKDGVSCNDLDECKCMEDGALGEKYRNKFSNKCDKIEKCSQGCENHIGAYKCLCNEGYYLLPDKISCDPVDECRCQEDISYLNEVQQTSDACTDVTRPENQCAQICNDALPGYECSCKFGYTLAADNHRCEDVDECSKGTDSCGPNQKCINEPGAYRCECDTGYVPAPTDADSSMLSCVVNKECPANHRCSHQCTLENGRERCLCEPGYKLDIGGTRCQDIDECAQSVCSIRQECKNTAGSYKCIDEIVPTFCSERPKTVDNWLHTGSTNHNGKYGSHVRTTKFKPNENIDISFQFKTFDRDGIVLYWSANSKKGRSPKKTKSMMRRQARQRQRRSKNKRAKADKVERIVITMSDNKISFEVLTEEDHYKNEITNVFSNYSPQEVRINTEWYDDGSAQITIQMNGDDVLKELITAPLPLRTMYFGGAVIPKSRVNALDIVPRSSFDGYFDFSSDSSFDNISPDKNSDNGEPCFDKLQRGMYVNGGSARISISKLSSNTFVSLYKMVTLTFAFKAESTRGDIISIGQVSLSMRQGRLLIEIKGDKNGPRDIPRKYWKATDCGKLHRVRIKTCVIGGCSKPSQISIDGMSLHESDNFELSDDSFGIEKNVNEVVIGGDSFKGAFYSFNTPSTEHDVPLQVILPTGQVNNLDNFLSHQDVYIESAPYLDLRESNSNSEL